MHSLSEIYTTSTSLSVVMWLSVVLLISGIFNKKSSLSFVSLILLLFVAYKMKGQLEVQSVSRYGANLILVSVLAYFSQGIKDKAAISVYTVIASLSFFVIHSYIPLNAVRSAPHKETIKSSLPQLDSNAELLVRFESQKDLLTWIDKHDSNYNIIYPAFNPKDKSYNLDEYLIVDLKPYDSVQDKIDELEKLDLVSYVEGNEILELKLPSSDKEKSSSDIQSKQDPFREKQWMADKFDLEKFHNDILKMSASYNSEGCTIAILDTGVDANHEDLKGNYQSTSTTYDSDRRGHGTHCAGIAAAVTGNNIGISSWIPMGLPIKVTSIKVLSSSGIGSQRTIINGILEAADNGYQIISMSLGGRSNPEREQAYNDAIRYANDKGSIVIVAAGNSSSDAARYSPANTPGVIAVAALDSKMELADFSNSVDKLSQGIAAPGADIFSTLPNNKYGINSGTSMAAPFVSGVISIMKYYNPNLTTEEVYYYLEASAIKKNNQLIINPSGALQLMLEAQSTE